MSRCAVGMTQIAHYTKRKQNMESMFDLSTYISKYDGYNKLHRLEFIAMQNESLQTEV